MEPEDFLWSLPFLILAAVMYSLHFWKTARGKSLLAESRTCISEGNLHEGNRLLKLALWKANEKPELELTILGELGEVYEAANIPCDLQDYTLLISQFRDLSKKGSTKALDELKKVQTLKRQLIEELPDVA